jgi:hypothetical protein
VTKENAIFNGKNAFLLKISGGLNTKEGLFTKNEKHKNPGTT